jgi:hypothetical protein
MRIGNLKDITISQCNSQQIIIKYVDDTSFTGRAEKIAKIALWGFYTSLELLLD